MQRHSALGYRIMLAGGLPEREALWVLHHHEHIDGSGYPHRPARRRDPAGVPDPARRRRLRGADHGSPLPARHVGRTPRSPEFVIAGTQVDRAVVDALVAVDLSDKPLSTPPPDAAAAVVEGPRWRLSEGWPNRDTGGCVEGRAGCGGCRMIMLQRGRSSRLRPRSAAHGAGP